MEDYPLRPCKATSLLQVSKKLELTLIGWPRNQIFKQLLHSEQWRLLSVHLTTEDDKSQQFRVVLSKELVGMKNEQNFPDMEINKISEVSDSEDDDF